MPFVLTCPECAARFHSPAGRPNGTGVECRKCGERFHVSADNQTEVSAAGRRRRGDGDDEFGHDFGRPRPKAGGRKAGLAILGVVGLLLLVGVGLGAYFVFGGGSGGPSKAIATRIPPKKDLPLDLLAYSPNQRPFVVYYDVAALRRAGPLSPAHVKRFPDLLPPGADLSLENVEAYCSMGGGPPGAYWTIVAVRLSAPRRADEVGGRCGFTPFPAGGVTAYQGPFKRGSAALFQATPDRLVFLASNSRQAIDNQTVVDLVRRDPSTTPIADDILDCVREVSGFPFIQVADIGNNVGGVWRVQVSGKSAAADGGVDHLRIRSFDSPADAAAWRKREKGDGPARADKSYETWLLDRRTFEFLGESGPMEKE